MAATDLGHDPCDPSTSDDPVMRLLTPRRVSQPTRPREGSVLP